MTVCTNILCGAEGLEREQGCTRNDRLVAMCKA